MNRFANPNAEHWIKFLFRRGDNLPFLTFYFLSKTGPTSPRFFPLYEKTSKFRIVLFKGSKIRKTDAISLQLFKLVSKALIRKSGKYQVFSPTSFESAKKSKTNLVLHLDDPEYSTLERESLVALVNGINKKVLIVCTNDFTYDYLVGFLPKDSVFILPQGYSKYSNSERIQESFDGNRPMKVAYSSSAIDIRGDRHEGHPTWDATHLICDILPEINRRELNLELHLIGKLGVKAGLELSKFKNVQTYGLVSFYENSKILQRCDVGLYPRIKDNFRSVQKITEYIGAGLPIITYDLIDTSIVKELNLGLGASNQLEMLDALELLSENPKLVIKYRRNVLKVRDEYSWDKLAETLENRLMEIT